MRTKWRLSAKERDALSRYRARGAASRDLRYCRRALKRCISYDLEQGGRLTLCIKTRAAAWRAESACAINLVVFVGGLAADRIVALTPAIADSI